MFLKKLSIWFVSIVLLSSCVNTYDKEIFNSIYIEKIPDFNGIMLRNELIKYFPNQNLSTSRYILRSVVLTTGDMELLNAYGLATQGIVNINYTFSVEDTKTKQIIFKGSNIFKETYPMDSNAYSSRQNRLRAVNTLNKNIAQYVLYQTYSLVSVIKNNNTPPSNNQTLDNQTLEDKILNESSSKSN